MNEKAYLYVKGNQAEVSLPAGASVQVRVKTNAKVTQRVRLVDQEFTGAGEGDTVIGETVFTPSGKSPLTAVFEYAGDDGVFKPSSLKSGGPYEIGKCNLLIAVAENGDDSDYNDTVLEFGWYTK